MELQFDFYTPTHILFGRGTLDRLGDQTLPGKKALLLTSCGRSARVSGALDRTLAQLERAGVEAVLFDKVMENPVQPMVMEGAACARDNGCDFVLALGGGAVLDSAVAIAAMAVNEGELWDYVCGGTGKGKTLARPGLPIVTVTLTAGTGSEVNCWGVISNPDTREKIGFGDPRLTPVLAIVDPELTRTVPPRYTAFQGFDALFHHTEVMMSRGRNLLSEAIALSAIEHIAAWLPRAVADGQDLEAREHVAYGSTLAGITMQLTSTTAQHSMEHALSAHHPHLPHGAGLILISEAFARFFLERHACDEAFVKMARAMGRRDASRPEEFVDALRKLQEDCGVADLKMSDYGVSEDECMTLAKGARSMQGGLFAANPCEMSDEDCAGVFRRSFR